MFDCIRYSYKSLVAKKTRLMLTLLSITIGIISVVIITSIGSSGENAVFNELDSLGLNGATIKTKKPNLSESDNEEIKELLNDCYVSPISKNASKIDCYGKEFDVVVWGGNEDMDKILNLNIIYGRGIRKKDIDTNRKITVIPKSVSEKLFGKADSVGKVVTLTGSRKQVDLTVAGIYDNSEIFDMISENMPVFCYIPFSSFNEIFEKSVNAEISIVSKNGENIEEYCKKAVSYLSNKYKDNKNYYYENLNIYKKSISDIAGMVTLIITLIGAVSLIVGGISVMNTMLITVNERKKEIGLKKAIGYTNLRIMNEFLSEALIIIILSCILGIVAGIIISTIILNFFSLTPVFDFDMIFKSVMFAMLTGIIFGIYPAIKAAKTEPVESLNS